MQLQMIFEDTCLTHESIWFSFKAKNKSLQFSILLAFVSPKVFDDETISK